MRDKLCLDVVYVHPQALSLRLNCVVCARHTCGYVTMEVGNLVLILSFYKLRMETHSFLFVFLCNGTVEAKPLLPLPSKVLIVNYKFRI